MAVLYDSAGKPGSGSLLALYRTKARGKSAHTHTTFIDGTCVDCAASGSSVKVKKRRGTRGKRKNATAKVLKQLNRAVPVTRVSPAPGGSATDLVAAGLVLATKSGDPGRRLWAQDAIAELREQQRYGDALAATDNPSPLLARLYSAAGVC